MKMAKKSLVLAIVATGTLLGSIVTSSAVAGPGDPLQGVIISLRGETTGTVKSSGAKGTKEDVSGALFDVGGHLLVQNTGTINPNGKKGTKKASASRKRRSRSVRARNAERRRQRQLKRQREFMELLEMLVVAVEEGDEECADLILEELEENFGQLLDILDVVEFEGPVNGSRSNIIDD